MRSIELIALDLDGTLIDKTLLIRPRVRDAVAAAKARGVRGCIATGRMFRAAVPFARTLEFDSPIICYQGAAIIDPNTDDVLQHKALENATVRDLIVRCKTDEKHLQLFKNDKYYVEKENEFSNLYAELSRSRPIVVASLLDEFLISPATKAVVIDHPEQTTAYLRELETGFAGRAYVTRSYPQFTELLNPHTNKGDALRFVATHLGIDLSGVMAIGDSWNDIPFLEAAGFGVAMGSAPPELRAVADTIVSDYAGDGVAEAIENYILQ